MLKVFELTLYLFAGKLVHLQWSRLGKKQEEYVPWIQRLCTNGDRLVLFTQNDDHIYVDYDASYLQKGLELMRSDYSLFKTMYISHWPELLRVCTKLPHNDGQLHGDFSRGLAQIARVFPDRNSLRAQREEPLQREPHCVERGRWAHESDSFRGHVRVPGAGKVLARGGDTQAGPGRLW